MTKVIFLDRDGVINEQRDDYVKSCSELSLLEGVKTALEMLKNNGYTIIVVSNQSAVGRGIMSESDLQNINKRLNERTGGLIDDFFYCPHKPSDNCGCRKPRTKMLVDAAVKYNVDLEGKWLIGDNSTDIELGKNAGLKTILVKTGLGLKVFSEGKVKPDYVTENLLEAVKIVLENEE